MKAQGVIFDVDGSLYPFDRGETERFEQSQFNQLLTRKIIKFFQDTFGISAKEAESLFADLNFRSGGQLSLWLEKEHGISRYEFFSRTWDFDPRRFMDKNDDLIACIGSVAARRAILSNAPRVWIDRVVEALELDGLFEASAIFSGEPDVRKPHPSAFEQVARHWGLAPESIVSIGDQEESDILPAKSLGMRTVRIGKAKTTAADFTAPDVPSAIKLLKKEKIL